MKKGFTPIKWENETLLLLDQRQLPDFEDYITVDTIEECYAVLSNMAESPLAGLTALWGLTGWLKLHVEKVDRTNRASLINFKKAADYLKSAQPGSVVLVSEINRYITIAEKHHMSYGSLINLYPRMVSYVNDLVIELEQSYQNTIKNTVKLLSDKYRGKKLNIMTIGNTGALSCGCLGAALGVIVQLKSEERLDQVYVCETRPLFYGSRFTSYELLKQDIRHRIIIDNAASFIMAKQKIDAVLAGGDWIAANGDTEAVIGTSVLSILANHYNIPFYITSLSRSIDMALKSGDDFPLNLHDQTPVLFPAGKHIAAENAEAMNPMSDTTRANNITAIICEKGVISPVNNDNTSLIMSNPL